MGVPLLPGGACCCQAFRGAVAQHILDARDGWFVLQRGGVTERCAFEQLGQQPAHDLAAAGFRHIGNDDDVPRLAIGPISFATCAFSTPWMSGVAAESFSTTNATIAWPVFGSATGQTPASTTSGWVTSADSTSMVESRCPETLRVSSTRPRIQMSPSSSYLAPSPARNQPCSAYWRQYESK